MLELRAYVLPARWRLQDWARYGHLLQQSHTFQFFLNSSVGTKHSKYEPMGAILVQTALNYAFSTPPRSIAEFSILGLVLKFSEQTLTRVNSHSPSFPPFFFLQRRWPILNSVFAAFPGCPSQPRLTNTCSCCWLMS